VTFSTGAAIARGTLRGAVFDWVGGKAAPRAVVEATGPDSLVYLAVAGEDGRFTIANVPEGTYLVRGTVDVNGNRSADPREPFDTARARAVVGPAPAAPVAPRDTLRARAAPRDTLAVGLYAFPRDTLGPRLTQVQPTDSVTLRLSFDRPLLPGQPFDTTRVRVLAADSTLVRVLAVRTPAAADSLARAAQARADSGAAPRDTAGGAAAAAARRPAAPPPARPRVLGGGSRGPGAPTVRRARRRSRRRSTGRCPPPTSSSPSPPRSAHRRRTACRRSACGRWPAWRGRATACSRRRARGGPPPRADGDRPAVTDPRRALPSVSALLEAPDVRALLAGAPRAVLVDAVRDALAAARAQPHAAPTSGPAWGEAIARALADRTRPSLRPVLNATGVVLHTNLGRAPLAAAAPSTPCARRPRGSRTWSTTSRPARAARATRTASRGCVPSPGRRTRSSSTTALRRSSCASPRSPPAARPSCRAVELVEIGGSFRVPDIMATSGARLREVGTTNRTHLADYAAALGPRHRAPGQGAPQQLRRVRLRRRDDAAELAPARREAGVPLLHDFGSGPAAPLDDVGLAGEPTARDLVAAGATLVLMSGDKLLGGPQAGVVVGPTRPSRGSAAIPLARAFRVDKLTLAALEATLALYGDAETARREIPALAMLTAAPEALRARAERLAERLAARGVASRVCRARGASAPAPSPRRASPAGRSPCTGTPRRSSARCAAASVPWSGRIHDDRLLLDLRSVPARDDARLADAVSQALTDAGLSAPGPARPTPPDGVLAHAPPTPRPPA
jgi:L-seryl-tRNA(Ser) seleniumtransferase